jgi:hypothetical protein
VIQRDFEWYLETPDDERKDFESGMVIPGPDHTDV